MRKSIYGKSVLKFSVFFFFFFILYFLFTLFSFNLSGFTSSSAEASIALKTIATNPSSTKTQTVLVKSYLPKDVEPKHIIDKGNFEVGYDFRQSLYYVSQDVVLAPKESIVLEVEIEDIWVIPQSDLDFLTEHLEDIMDFLETTSYYEAAKSLGGSISERLEEIAIEQKRPLVSVDGHILRHQANSGIFKKIESDLNSLEELVVEVKGSGAKETLLYELSSEDEMLDLRKLGLDIDKLGILTFNVVAINPSASKTQTLPLKHYLPKEVEPEYVVDAAGLKIGYDANKKLHYLYTESITLGPGELKKFAVKIKDIWIIPEGKRNILRTRGQKILKLLKDGKNYERASFLVEAIDEDLNDINSLEKLEVKTYEEHIGNYRISLKKLNAAKRNLSKLEKMAVRVVGASSLAAIGGNGGIGSGFFEEKKRAGKFIFKGKIPSVSSTWSLIYKIIGFLAIVSLIFFILQFVQHKQSITDNLTGVYTRGYIAGRLPQELKKCKKQKINYAVLVIDVDKFKSLNDKYGHLIGDTVLREVVAVIKRNLRTMDIISRFGGDEFLVGLPRKNKKEAQLVGERLVKAVTFRKIKARFGAEALVVSISVGAAIFPDDAEDYENLLHKADEALYVAKAKGGNAVFVYNT